MHCQLAKKTHTTNILSLLSLQALWGSSPSFSGSHLSHFAQNKCSFHYSLDKTLLPDTGCQENEEQRHSPPLHQNMVGLACLQMQDSWIVSNSGASVHATARVVHSMSPPQLTPALQQQPPTHFQKPQAVHNI